MRRVDASSVVAAPLWASQEVGGVSSQTPSGQAEWQRAEWEATLERGYRDGHARGVADAEEAARAQAAEWQRRRQEELDAARGQYEDAARQLEALAKQIPLQIQAEAERAESLAIEIAYSAVVRLLGSAHADRRVMQPLIEQAVQDVGIAVDRVYLSDDDALALEDVAGIEVVVDPALSPGQCRLESRLGSYDAGLDVRLERLRSALLDGLSQHRREPSAA